MMEAGNWTRNVPALLSAISEWNIHGEQIRYWRSCELEFGSRAPQRQPMTGSIYEVRATIAAAEAFRTIKDGGYPLVNGLSPLCLTAHATGKNVTFDLGPRPSPSRAFGIGRAGETTQ